MYNYTDEDWRDLAIGEVLRAPVFKRQEIISSHRELLKDVDFIYVDEQHGQDLIESVLDMFGIGNERMCSVFYSNKLDANIHMIPIYCIIAKLFSKLNK